MFRLAVMSGELSPAGLSDDVPVYGSEKEFIEGVSRHAT